MPSIHCDIQSDYLNSCFLDLELTVNEAVEKLKPHSDRFEAVVVRGTSGLLVGPMAAALLKKLWCIIRKPGDGTHSDHKVVEGWTGFKTYIIIDDLVATGGTLKLIQQTLREHAKAYRKMRTCGIPDCIGYYLYNHQELNWRGNGRYPHDKYFLFPEGLKRPDVSEQIFATAATRQNPLALALARQADCPF